MMFFACFQTKETPLLALFREKREGGRIRKGDPHLVRPHERCAKRLLASVKADARHEDVMPDCGEVVGERPFPVIPPGRGSVSGSRGQPAPA